MFINNLCFSKISVFGSKKNVPFFKNHELRFAALCAIAFAAISGVLFSCAKEELDEDVLKPYLSPAREINVEASASGCGIQDPDKAYLPDNSFDVLWESGDAIRVNNAVLATGRGGATTAFFSGSVSAMKTGQSAVNEHYFAVYPSDLSNIAVSNLGTAPTFNVNLPDVQRYTEGKMPANCMVAHTRVPSGTEDIALNFKNICSVLKFNLKAKDGESCTKVSKIMVTSTDGGKNISGQCKIGFTTGGENPTVTYSADATTKATIIIDCGEGVDISTAKTFYLMMAPQAGATKISVKIFGVNGKYMQKGIASRTYLRNNIYTATEENVVFGKEIGFTVDNSGNRVTFSPGNLQWSANNGGSEPTTHAVAGGGTAAGTWRFALHEEDYVGKGTHSVGLVYMADGTTKCNNELIASDYAGWIDVFGFATSGWTDCQGCLQPYAVNPEPKDYGPRAGGVYQSLTGYYANCDWGIYNEIWNPATGQTDAPGTWFTLSYEQWKYLLNNHTIGYSCTVKNVKGVVLCPDDFDDPKVTTTGSKIAENAAYDADGWAAMKEAGAVFLPYGGSRNGKSDGKATVMANIGQGYYWSTTPRPSKPGWSYHPFFTTGVQHDGDYTNEMGRCVRLVKWLTD